MPATSLQSVLHNLSVGTPVNVNLNDYMTNGGTNFYVIGSSALLSEDDLPPGLSLSSNGVISGTPTQAAVRVCTIRAENGTFNSEADWTARTATAVASHKIDSQADVDEATQSPVGGAKNGDSGWNFWNTLDTSVGLYGSGSMRYWYPDGATVAATNIDVRSGVSTMDTGFVAEYAVANGFADTAVHFYDTALPMVAMRVLNQLRHLSTGLISGLLPQRKETGIVFVSDAGMQHHDHATGLQTKVKDLVHNALYGIVTANQYNVDARLMFAAMGEQGEIAKKEAVLAHDVIAAFSKKSFLPFERFKRR
jgi:hypothetical protein